MSTGSSERDDPIGLAGEYVLRLLPEDELPAFEARLARDPELRALVAAWQADLVHLTDEVAPVEPPARVAKALETELFADEASASPGLFGRLRQGFGLSAIAAGLVAIGLFFGADLMDRGPQPPVAPALTATIAAEDESLVVAAAFDAEADQLFLAREAGQAAPGRALELWLIAGDEPPVSLGLLSDEPLTVVTVSADLAPRLAGGVLAISDEPPGGSPTGAPTGAVLAVGPVSDATGES
jgi:anti-sigma-K factor RskA